MADVDDQHAATSVIMYFYTDRYTRRRTLPAVAAIKARTQERMGAMLESNSMTTWRTAVDRG